MSQSVIPAEASLVTYNVTIDGNLIPGDYQITSIEINKEVNKIPTAKIKVVDGGYRAMDEDFRVSNSGLFDPGKKIQIKAGYHSREDVVYEGIIVKQSIKMSASSALLLVECKEESIRMTLARNNAVYLDKKDSDIISELARNSKLDVSAESTSVRHPEVVQYYCSDWDFMLMRADLNGQVVISDGKKLKIGKPDISGSPEVEIENGKSLYKIDVEIDARNQFNKVSSVGWDYSNQKIIKSSSKTVSDVKIGIDSQKLNKVHGVSEYHLQTGAHVPKNLLEIWATGKLTRSRLSKVQGTVSFYGNADVKPGCLIRLSGLSKSFNGDVYVSGVKHFIDDGNWVTEAKIGFGFKSYAEETPAIESPSSSGMLAGIKGLQTAIVKKIDKDKEGQHRIQLAYPTLEKDNMGIWARLATFYATKDSGVFFIPEINDEVVIGFINEDPQQPVILGSVYSSKNKPPLTSEKENNIKALVTKSKMKISFDEKKKIIKIETPGKNSIVLDDDKGSITVLDKNKNQMEMSKDGITFDCAKDFTVKAKGKIVLEATADIEQKATGNLKGEGMAVEFKGKTKFAAEGAMTEVKGSAQTVVKGGIVMIN